jgi:hypothetical protein
LAVLDPVVPAASDRASSTATDAPSRAQHSAVQSPANPAPTTTTSTGSEGHGDDARALGPARCQTGFVEVITGAVYPSPVVGTRTGSARAADGSAEPRVGIEPTTYALRVRCSTD